MTKQWLVLRNLKTRYRCSAMTVYRWVKNPDLDFPKPIYLGRVRYWDADEIAEWEAKQRAKSREAVEAEAAGDGTEEADAEHDEAA